MCYNYGFQIDPQNKSLFNPVFFVGADVLVVFAGTIILLLVS